MKLLARIPLIKNILARAAVFNLAPSQSHGVTSQYFESEISVNGVIEELRHFGYSKKLTCSPAVISVIEKLAQTLPLYAYHKKENQFVLSEKAKMECKLSQDILIAAYANLASVPLFAELENDDLIGQIAKGYLGKNARCIASQMWWTFPADVSDAVRSKAAHYYHRDLDAYQFMKFFIYATDVQLNDGGHFS